MKCKECHHLPSCRFDAHGVQCYCECHDVADAGPDLLPIVEEWALTLEGVLQTQRRAPNLTDLVIHNEKRLAHIRAAIAKAKGKS